MSFILILLLPLEAWAGGACGGHVATIQKLRAESCKIEMVTANCRSTFEAAPETLPFAKDCNDDMGDKEVTVLATCARAVGAAWTGLYKSLYHTISENKATIDECERDPKLTCKRRLATEGPFTCASGRSAQSLNPSMGKGYSRNCTAPKHTLLTTKRIFNLQGNPNRY